MEALEPELLTLTVGQHFGNYRLLRLVGSGAFANIYLGEHRYLRTQAAVKIARRQITRSERFLKEARIAAQLVHPRIVRILDFGIDEKRNIPFLVMDYAARGSLRQRHPVGERLARHEILGYAWDIAEALEYIHAQNYIHRDLKPENLLIGNDGQILVSDFGIAITVQETWGTQVQESIGTLPYMAPEQLLGRPCIASDQYALGVIIYEWMSGELPFNEDISDLALQHLQGQPTALRHWRPDLSPAVEQVVHRALARDPRQRFASIVEFVSQLEEAWLETPAQYSSFYDQATTYDTETPRKLPAIKPIILPNSTKQHETRFSWSTQKTWRIATYSFALDLLLCLIVLLCTSHLSWGLPTIVLCMLIAGLPSGIGLLWRDQRTLMLAILPLSLELVSMLLFQTPLAFLWLSLLGMSLCATMAFTLFLRFF